MWVIKVRRKHLSSSKIVQKYGYLLQQAAITTVLVEIGKEEEVLRYRLYEICTAEGIVNSRPIYLRVISDTSFLASRCVNEGFLSLLSRVTPC